MIAAVWQTGPHLDRRAAKFAGQHQSHPRGVALAGEPMGHGHMTHTETLADRDQRFACISACL
jgi:hypothetical protein